MPFPYRSKFYSYLPTWAVNIPGSQVWAVTGSFGRMLDKVAFLLQKAFEQRFLEKQWASQLIKTGKWFKTPKYALDTDSSYRNRLLATMDRFTLLGTSPGIVKECAYLGFTVEVSTAIVWDQPTKTWDQSGESWDSGFPVEPEAQGLWNRFWLIVKLAKHIPSVDWDQESETWDQSNKIWDQAPVTKQELDTLISIGRRWRACYNQFYAVRFESTIDDSYSTYILPAWEAE